MSNEQFNKLTPEELLKQHSIELKNMLPTLDKTLNDVTPLIATLIEQYGDFVREALKAIPESIGNIFQQSGTTQQDHTINVRLSQGSQQYQRDRELYAGGALSQFQLDQQRQQQRSNLSAQERANEIYLQNQRARAANARAAALLERTRNPIVSQIAKTNLTGKRAAGQSQILERANLIKQIAHWGRLVKANPAGTGFTRNLRGFQQKLVNLLSRYRF